MLQDSVRGFGPTTKLSSSSTQHENDTNSGGSYGITDPQWGYLTSVDEGGFSLSDTGTADQVNYSGSPYVAWCWKAGGAAVANNDGSITSQVSVNQTAGFSIVSYTGTGSSGTVGHGLAKTPKFVIIKNRDSTTNWRVYTTEVDGSMDYLYLNLTNGKQNSGATPFTSSVFELGTNSDQNANTNTYIAYCWAEIEGYSKFGSYIGNGSTDGPFVYCGFKPAWVMIKVASGVTNGWVIMDNARSSNNPNGETLFASTSATEYTGISLREMDFLSNGFKIRAGTGTERNTNGGTYIFMAFAESPFQTANAK